MRILFVFMYVFAQDSYIRCVNYHPLVKIFVPYFPLEKSQSQFPTLLVACGNNCHSIGNIFHYMACETVN